MPEIHPDAGGLTKAPRPDLAWLGCDLSGVGNMGYEGGGVDLGIECASRGKSRA